MTRIATAKPATVPSTAGPADQGSLGKAIGVAAVGSVAVNAVIAAIALGPLDASSEFEPLTPGPYVFLTVLGVVLAAFAWRAIARRAADPARTLGWLVPTVVALSLIPDAGVYFADSQPGVSGVAVLALVAMHLATATIAVTAFRRFLPLGR